MRLPGPLLQRDALSLRRAGLWAPWKASRMIPGSSSKRSMFSRRKAFGELWQTHWRSLAGLMFLLTMPGFTRLRLSPRFRCVLSSMSSIPMSTVIVSFNSVEIWKFIFRGFFWPLASISYLDLYQIVEDFLLLLFFSFGYCDHVPLVVAMC